MDMILRGDLSAAAALHGAEDPGQFLFRYGPDLQAVQILGNRLYRYPSTRNIGFTAMISSYSS